MNLPANYLATARRSLFNLPFPNSSQSPSKRSSNWKKLYKDEEKNPLLYIKPKSGDKIATEITTGVLHIKDKSYVFAIYRDITLQLENQEAIKRKSTELEKSNQALKDFVSIASRDLQAPLRKIISFSSRLESEREKIRP